MANTCISSSHSSPLKKNLAFRDKGYHGLGLLGYHRCGAGRYAGKADLGARRSLEGLEVCLGYHGATRKGKGILGHPSSK